MRQTNVFRPTSETHDKLSIFKTMKQKNMTFKPLYSQIRFKRGNSN